MRALPRPARGFTLIELMVVMLIVGILMGSVTLGLDALRGRDAERALARIKLVLEASAERASVRGEPLALELLADGYRFARFDTDGRWRPLNDPPVFSERLLPQELSWGALAVNGQPVAERRLIFGTLAPRFELTVHTPTGVVRFIGSETGRVLQEAPVAQGGPS